MHYAFTARFDASERARLRELLDEAEVARSERFKFERDRHTYVVAHALVRTVLASQTGLDPREHAFEAGEHGKPELTTPGAAPGLRFNLSHADGLVAVATGLEDDLGVDVELRSRRVEIDQVARGVFSPAEIRGLSALSGDAKRARFFQLWTLKEAYIKAVGQGLSMPLRGMTVDVEAEPPTLDLGETGLGDGRDWRLALAEPGEDHQLAFAVRTRRPPVATLREWRGELGRV